MWKQWIKQLVPLMAMAVLVFGNRFAAAEANAAPLAAFSSMPDSGSAPLTVILDAGASADSDGAILEYNWLINGKPGSLGTDTEEFTVINSTIDSVQASGQTYTVTRRVLMVQFKQDGTYTVGLSVKDNGGLVSAETSRTVKVGAYGNQYLLLFSTNTDKFTTVSRSRSNLQRMYALETAKQLIGALDAYRSSHQAPMPAAEMDALVLDLLQNGQDSIVQSVTYMPGQSLEIRLHDSPFVEGNLRGVSFPFKFEPSIQKWVVDIRNYPIQALFIETEPDAREMGAAMRLISYFCANNSYTMANKPDKLPGPVWCPVWHNKLLAPVHEWTLDMSNLTVLEMVIGIAPQTEHIPGVMDMVSTYCTSGREHIPDSDMSDAMPTDVWCDAWLQHVWPAP